MGIRRRPSKATPATGDAEVSRSARKFPPEAFDYEDDVSPKVVKSIQDRADQFLKKGKWVVVDG